MKIVVFALCSSLLVTGCASTGGVAGISAINSQDVIKIGNAIVAVECSPALATGSAIAVNVLSIKAPNDTAVKDVVKALNTNLAVAATLCPAVNAIKASVGSVPATAPSQVISVAPTVAAATK
jgi:hypothetical protein